MTVDLQRPSPIELERAARELDPEILSIEDQKLLADCIREFNGNFELGAVAYFVLKIEEAENERSNKRDKS